MNRRPKHELEDALTTAAAGAVVIRGDLSLAGEALWRSLECRQIDPAGFFKDMESFRKFAQLREVVEIKATALMPEDTENLQKSA